MNGQQAPTSRPTVSARQSARLAPSHTASMNRNRIGRPGRSHEQDGADQRQQRVAQPLNSRSCIQPTTPPIARGGAIGAIIAWRMKAELAVWSVIVALTAPPAARGHCTSS